MCLLQHFYQLPLHKVHADGVCDVYHDHFTQKFVPALKNHRASVVRRTMQITLTAVGSLLDQHFECLTDHCPSFGEGGLFDEVLEHGKAVFLGIKTHVVR